MATFTLVTVVVSLLIVAVCGQESADCTSKCQCSDVENKTEFCAIKGFTRKTFSSSCEMVCYNCQKKTNFKYFSTGKCPANSNKRQRPNKQKGSPGENTKN
ncbi:Hypothetical predicted protein [Cloeon dipterum]|uniref:Kazal-like domain-containing protein n=1 Tax=Cloeon dipterum TaxID=197152 RepID=A0A8S1DL36_9INSE|nr:Hypothetical predicted protein [Cloeon dipterum]